MSVSTIRNLLEKSGCVAVVSVLMAAVFAFGLLSQCSRAQPRGGQAAQAEARNFVVLGETKAPYAVVEAMYRMAEQQLERPGSAPLSFEQQATAYLGALQQTVQMVAMVELAREKGIDFSSEGIASIRAASAKTEFESLRQFAIAQAKLKPDASDAEVKAAIKQQFKMDVDAERSKRDAASESRLTDPNQRLMEMANLAAEALKRMYENQIRPSDDDLKRQSMVLKVRRIYFGPSATREQAEKVLQEIRGGLKFADAVAKHSKDLPEPGKTLAESQQSLPGSVTQSMPELAPLFKLAAGQVSDVVESKDGFAIYQIVSSDPNLPKDFEKQKATLRQQFIANAANAALMKDLDAKTKKATEAIESKVMAAAVETYQQLSSATSNDKLRSLLKVLAEAQDERAALYARFLAFETLYRGYSPAEKEAAKPDRIELLQDVLTVAESIPIRLELFDLLAEDKGANLEKMIENLSMAAQANVDTTSYGQTMYGEIAKRIAKLESMQVDKDAVASIRKEQQRWKEDKITYDREKAEFEKEQAKEKARQEAEDKAERAKAAAQDAKARDELQKETPKAPPAPSNPLPTGR